jgi:hypothetical protein
VAQSAPTSLSAIPWGSLASFEKAMFLQSAARRRVRAGMDAAFKGEATGCSEAVIRGGFARSVSVALIDKFDAAGISVPPHHLAKLCRFEAIQ